MDIEENYEGSFNKLNDLVGFCHVIVIARTESIHMEVSRSYELGTW
jgi:hypothetical protein